nr:MAG TPA: hypothetical protein [Caudoviricetes sp.]
MGVKLMTGATGEQNIQAADDRECLAGITGIDSYVFPTGSQLKATLVDANTVTIGTGAGSLQGSRFRCSTTTTVNIQSGTQGQFRRDIIGLHFSRETSGREGLEFQVLTGEPVVSEGAAADPAYTVGDLLKGDAEAFMPLYRIKLSGINASDPEPLFSVLTPLATLGDLTSHYITKTFTTPSTTVKYGDALDIDVGVKIDGYTPVCITEVWSNHAGSCCITQFGLRDNEQAFATVKNLELIHHGTWNDLKLRIKVLYRKIA